MNYNFSIKLAIGQFKCFVITYAFDKELESNKIQAVSYLWEGRGKSMIGRSTLEL